MKKLYGKVSRTSKKEECFTKWREGLSFKAIAAALSIQEATAEVYIIDMVFVGHAMAHERAKLLQDVGMTQVKQQMMRELIRNASALREVKDRSVFRYNQIRAFIACLVNDE